MQNAGKNQKNMPVLHTEFVELGGLQETTNAARNRVFEYEEYLEILRKNT